jgi:hypothetical protein
MDFGVSDSTLADFSLGDQKNWRRARSMWCEIRAYNAKWPAKFASQRETSQRE